MFSTVLVLGGCWGPIRWHGLRPSSPGVEAARRSCLSWEQASSWGTSRHLETFSCNKQVQSKAAFQREATFPSRPHPLSHLLAGRPRGAAKGTFVSPEKQNKTKQNKTNPERAHTHVNATASGARTETGRSVAWPLWAANKGVPWLACS